MKLKELVDNVSIDPRKLTEYALNPESPLGKHKAGVFKRVLGFTRENYGELLFQIEHQALDAQATFHSEDEFGRRYTVDLNVEGPEGQAAVVCRLHRLAGFSRRERSPFDHVVCEEVRGKMPELFDVVELITDIPAQALYAGMQGTIVTSHPGDAYEVEFTSESGETLALLALRADQFIVIWRSNTRAPVSVTEQVMALMEKLPESAEREVLDFARFLHERRRRAHLQQLNDSAVVA